MTHPDLTAVWAARKRRQGFRVTPGAQGPVVINESGEEAYCYLYDSRDDSRLRIPRETREYYLHKPLPLLGAGTNGRPVLVGKVKRGLYHEHPTDGACPVTLTNARPPAAGPPVSVVAPQDRVKPRRRRRGARGKK